MSETFRMVPATGVSFWIIGLVCILISGLVLTFSYLLYSSRNTTFTVSPEGLRISGTLYGRLIPKETIQMPRVKVVDLSSESNLCPSWRTNGIGLPGYGAGWFRLNNGEKALLFLTERRNVVYVPTTSGFSLLLSVADTDRFMDTLEKICATL